MNDTCLNGPGVLKAAVTTFTVEFLRGWVSVDDNSHIFTTILKLCFWLVEFAPVVFGVRDSATELVVCNYERLRGHTVGEGWDSSCLVFSIEAK